MIGELRAKKVRTKWMDVKSTWDTIEKSPLHEVVGGVSSGLLAVRLYGLWTAG